MACKWLKYIKRITPANITCSEWYGKVFPPSFSWLMTQTCQYGRCATKYGGFRNGHCFVQQLVTWEWGGEKVRMVLLALTAVELEHCWRWWSMRMCSCWGWQWFTVDEWFWWELGCGVAMMMHREWISVVTKASLVPTIWHWKQTNITLIMNTKLWK
jgi:hypothetical protein